MQDDTNMFFLRGFLHFLFLLIFFLGGGRRKMAQNMFFLRVLSVLSSGGGSTQDGPKHVLPMCFFSIFVLGAGDGRWSKTCSVYAGFSCFLWGGAATA